MEEINQLKLLVVTPVFNGEKYLEETINSVLSAKISSMEYLIVNDGSTDGTSRILEKYNGRIKVIEQSNSGESSAVNVGFNAFDSEYVMIVSADDLVSEDIFRKLIDVLDLNPKHAVAYPDWHIIDGKGSVISDKQTLEFSKPLLYEKMLCIPGPGSLIRRSALKRNFLRNESFVYIGDFESWLYLAKEHEFKRVPEYLAKWRFHGENISITGRSLKMANEFIRVYKELILENSSIDEIKPFIKKGLGTAYYSAARLVYFDERIPSRVYFFKSLYWNFFLKKDVLTVGYIIVGRFLRRFLTPIVLKFTKREMHV